MGLHKVSKNVVLTTVFPVERSIWQDYFKSLVEQTFNDFDILFVDDGFNEWDEVKVNYPSLHWNTIKGTSNIAKNRALLIDQAIQNYDYAVLADFDDFFSNNRVEASLKALSTSEIAVNDITIFHSDGRTESNYFCELDTVSKIDFKLILQRNYFGLSNTAFRCNVAPRVNFPQELKAIDWFFYSLFLMNDVKVAFLPNVQTYYRQHENNIANITYFDRKQVEQELQVKKLHYFHLQKYRSEYRHLADMYMDFEKAFVVMPEVVKNQIGRNSNAWWSLIELEY